MTDDLLDPRLRAEVLAASAKLPIVPSVARVPPSLLARAQAVRVVETADAATRMLDDLQRLDVAFAGIDTEFRYAIPGDAPDADEEDEWQDVSRLRPIAFSLTAMIPASADDGHVPVRYSIDVRNAEVLTALDRVLRLPLTFIAHHFKSEFMVVRALGLTWPTAFFCTWVAAQLLELGRHHARYVNPDPVDDVAEEEARRAALNQRVGATSLLGQLAKYRIDYPFGGGKKEMQQRFRRLPDGEPLTALDHEYASADAYGAAVLYLPQRLDLARQGLDHHYDRIELPGALVLAEIECHGVTVSREKIHLARSAAERAVEDYEGKLQPFGFRVDHASQPEIELGARPSRVMVTSYNERARVLGDLGLLDAFRSGSAARGHSFRRDMLKQNQGLHDVVRLLYLHTKYAGIMRDRLFDEEYIGTDRRVHPWINVLGADSGRPSFKRPNLVGIGKVLRPIVVPDGPEFDLAELDYVAQEVFIAAAHYGDDVLLADCNRGDPYCEMVRRFCRDELPPGGDTLADAELAQALGAKTFKDLRDRMKILMLATMYGMGDASIAAQAKTTAAGAARLRERFFERYHGLRDGIDLAIRQLQERGYAKTITGLRRRRGHVGQLSNWERNWATNAPIQGGGACVLKLLLPRITDFLAPYGGRVVLPIFDAVLIQYRREHSGVVLPGAHDLMIKTMRELYPTTQPRVDVNASAPACWNKNGAADSIGRFIANPEYKP